MSKLLLLLVLAAALYFLLRPRSVRESSPPRGAPVEDMVACARCGLNIPRSEAIQSRGLAFCSDEHRLLGPR